MMKMPHNEARELLVRGYEATHDAERIAKAYSVSKWTVYRLAEQKRKTGTVTPRTSQPGRKPLLTQADKEQIHARIRENKHELDPTVWSEFIIRTRRELPFGNRFLMN